MSSFANGAAFLSPPDAQAAGVWLGDIQLFATRCNFHMRIFSSCTLSILDVGVLGDYARLTTH